MNSCRYCKFLRANREECFCYSLNKNYLQEGQDLFLVPQQINFSCDYCEPISWYSDLYLYTSDRTPITPATQDIWKDIWG